MSNLAHSLYYILCEFSIVKVTHLEERIRDLEQQLRDSNEGKQSLQNEVNSEFLGYLKDEDKTLQSNLLHSPQSLMK